MHGQGEYATAIPLYISPSILARLVTGEWVDEDVHDPLSSMFSLLTEKRDKALAQHWGLWLLKYDQDRAMKVRKHMIYCGPRSSLVHHSSFSLSGSGSAPQKVAAQKSQLSYVEYRKPIQAQGRSSSRTSS